MSRLAAPVGAVAILLAGMALAAPDRSLHPEPRPADMAPGADAGTVAMSGGSLAGDLMSIPEPVQAAVVLAPRLRPAARPGTPEPSVAIPPRRPETRPVSAQVIAAAARPDTAPLLGPQSSPRPAPRTDAVVQQALFQFGKRRKGSVCGDIDLQGVAAGDIGGPRSGCFIDDAVRLTSVSGVRLSQPALMTCQTAKALKSWVDRGVQPAFGARDPVAELKVVAHYACRTRNNVKGAKLSEHAKGKAVDIAGFVTRSGAQVSVLEDWGKGEDGKALAQVHKAACGPFGTVLGPKSDRHHRDHFHLDTAGYRSGPYCR